MNHIIDSVVNLFHSFITQLNQLGGEFIDEGGFGAVFSPAFYFDRETKQIEYKENYISKILILEDGENEMKQIHLINSIDPTHIFTPHVFVGQIISRTDLKHAENIDEINHSNVLKYIESDAKLYNIIIQNCGHPIDRIMGNMLGDNIYYLNNIDALYESLYNSINGIDIINQHSVIHNDIKIDNILYDGNKTYIIDFGESKNISNIIENTNLLMFYNLAIRLGRNVIDIANIQFKVRFPIEYKLLGLIFYDPYSPVIQNLPSNDEMIDYMRESYESAQIHYSNLHISDGLRSFVKLFESLYHKIEVAKNRKLRVSNRFMDFDDFETANDKFDEEIGELSDEEFDEQEELLYEYMNQFKHTSEIVEVITHLYSCIDSYCFGHTLNQIVKFDKKIIDKLYGNIDDNTFNTRIVVNNKYKKIANKLSTLVINERLTAKQSLDVW